MTMALGTGRYDVPGLELDAGTASTVLDLVRQAVSDATLPADSIATDGSNMTVSGLFLEYAQAETYGAVPRSALFTSDGGATCVFLTAPSPERSRPRAVDVEPKEASELGVALVPAGLIGNDVVLQPLTLGETVTKTCE